MDARTSDDSVVADSVSSSVVFSTDSLPSLAEPDDSASITRRKFIGQAAGVGLAAVSLLGTSDSYADGTQAGADASPQQSLLGATKAQPAGDLDPDMARTILEPSGRLLRPVAPETFALWKRELNRTRLIEIATPRKAALLHLLVGEYELASNEEPVKAGWHFRRAQQLVKHGDRLYGWASFNAAMGLFYEGAYEESAQAFHGLLHHAPSLTGFDRVKAARWQRHTGACAADHTALDALDIRRPTRLDPLCGVAGLCISLRKLGLPGWDKKTVIAKTHVTGRGTTAKDLLDACPKIGGGMAVGRLLSADEKGLIALPKPLIAHASRDHFITVVEANKDGVQYLCTDCGAWPGGRIKLTWEQWRALKPGVFLSVVKRGSLEDRVLAALIDHPVETKREAALTTSGIPGVQVAMNPLQEGQSLGGSLLPLSSMFRNLVNHIAPLMVLGGESVTCGFGPNVDPCAPCIICCAMAGMGFSAQDANFHATPGEWSKPPMIGDPPSGNPGPAHGDPVNLATLEEEYWPNFDIAVYNPNGPSITWNRVYNSLRGYNPGTYQYDDFGMGWSHSYNYGISSTAYIGGGGTGGGSHPNRTPGGPKPPAPVPSGPQYVIFPNGAKISFTIPVMPTASTPSVACTVQTGAPLLVSIFLDTTVTGPYPGYYFTVTTADQTTMTFYMTNVSNTYYPLGQVSDRVGNTLDFGYSSVAGNNSGLPVLTQINDDSTGNLLLTINRSGGGAITSLADCYGRSIYYSTSLHASANIAPGWPSGQYELDQVSQIVTTGGASSPPMRYQYSYSLVYNGENSEQVPFLTGITVPSPTGSGTSTATLAYQDYTGYIARITDGNGNVTSFTPCNSSGTAVGGSGVSNYTLVTTKNPAGTVVYSYIGGFDGNMSGSSITDGAGTATQTKVFSDPNNPYRPSSVQDGVGHTWSFTWDQYGNKLTETTPRGTVTTNSWDYSHFALGRLTSVQEGSKGATTFTYLEPTGLLATVTKPAPGSVGAGNETVSISYTYSALGNLLTVTAPGNGTATSIVTTLSFTTDGTYSQQEAMGQALAVTDNLGHTSHVRYTDRGLVSSNWDALGNTYNNTYNIANQLVESISPATDQTGTGQSYTLNIYQYPGGLLSGTAAYDESNNLMRQVYCSYGAEGEPLQVTGSTEPVACQYDAVYRKTALTDGKGNTTSYSFNLAGQPSQITYPSGQYVQLTSFNANGQLLQRIDANSVTTNYIYGDVEGAISAVQYPATPANNAAFSYDIYGRRIAKSDSCGSRNYYYDDLDNLTSVVTSYTGLASKTISYSYNADGSRSAMGTPAGSFSYNYDGGCRMTSLSNPFSETTEWSCLDNDWLSTQTQANGVTAATRYNALGQITEILNRLGSGGSATTLSDFSSMSYDGVGNRLAVSANVPSVASLNGSVSYTYDAKDELTAESSTRASGIASSFGYDAAGNPTTFQGVSQSFNSNNQLSATGFSFDGYGNPTTRLLLRRLRQSDHVPVNRTYVRRGKQPDRCGNSYDGGLHH